MTPEGKVKAAVNRVIDQYKSVYKFMPVPGGFGASSLDYLLCVSGHFCAVETKAAGKRPTDRQKMVVGQITRAGGKVFIIDGENGQLEEFKCWLEEVTRKCHTPTQ